MRVAIDLTSLADNFSGIERYAAEISRRLIEDSSIDWTLIFKKEIHSIFRNAAKSKNVTCITLNPCNKFFFYQIRLPRAMRKINADINLFLAFPPAIFAKKKKAVVAVHDMVCWDCPDTMKLLSKWYFRISMLNYIKKCRRIITISNFSKERILDKFPCVKDKISIVYCGIGSNFCKDISNLKAKNAERKYKLPETYILSLSTIEPRKNLGLLLEAYAQLCDEGHSLPDLVLAGRKGWLFDDLENIVERYRDKIHFTGFIADEDLPAIYKGSRLFIFPSKYEGFGIPPLEALATGTPVLSSNAASLPEVLGDSVFYFQSNNLECLKQSILACLKTDIDLEQRNRGIRQANKFSWAVEAHKLVGALTKE